MILSTRLIAAEVTWSAINGGLSADNAPLTDRSPASRVALTWSSGAQTTASTVSLVADCDVTPRMVALLGVDLPSGLKVELWGKRGIDAGFTYNLGGNSQSQDLVTFDDGSVGAVWVLADGLDQVEKLELRFFNDVAGVAVIAASAPFEIGEVVIAEAVEVAIETGWRFDNKDPSKARRTLGSQIDRVRRTGYRTLNCTPCFATTAEARSGGLGSTTDWQRIMAAMRADPYLLAVVHSSTSADIQDTAIFGIATKTPSLEALSGPYYGPGELVIEEVPS